MPAHFSLGIHPMPSFYHKPTCPRAARLWRLIDRWVLLGLMLFGMGCSNLKVTEPKRSVAEQLLLSSAADRAIEKADLAELRGKAVYLQERYFKSYDKRFVLGAIREHLARNGALLVGKEGDAEIIVEARNAGLGIETRESLIGIPALNLPVPLAGALQSPEIGLYKSQKADSAARFALFAYDRKSGAFVQATGGISGAAYFHHYKFLGFFNWRRTDVPELQSKLKARLRRGVNP